MYLCETLAKQVCKSAHLTPNQVDIVEKSILLLATKVTAKLLDNIRGTKDGYFKLIIKPEI